jgi:hypothetical protein
VVVVEVVLVEVLAVPVGVGARDEQGLRPERGLHLELGNAGGLRVEKRRSGALGGRGGGAHE